MAAAEAADAAAAYLLTTAFLVCVETTPFQDVVQGVVSNYTYQKACSWQVIYGQVTFKDMLWHKNFWNHQKMLLG